MDKSLYIAVFLFMLAAFAPSMTLAAPFCVEGRGFARTCNYFDPAQCIKQAEVYNGTCTVMPEMIVSTVGTERHCRVDDLLRAYCQFPDRESCDDNARNNNSVCISQMLMNTDNSIFQFDLDEAP